MTHLLAAADLDRPAVEELFAIADACAAEPRMNALAGRTVATVFFEDSTRTRLSFERAAKRLGADVMTFSVGTSSVKKGESVRDTIRTIDALGADVLVIRHGAAGAAQRVAVWTSAAVVNAGDGRHEHPTQALLDAYTLRAHRGDDLTGLRMAIVGDIAHSRVARSNIALLSMLGVRITLVGPPTLLPRTPTGWPVHAVTTDLDAVLDDVDVVYLLRLQRERQGAALLPALREYATRWGMTAERLARCKPDVLVLHPGPIQRGVEIAASVADSPQSCITEQVAHGVPVRMAVLARALAVPMPRSERA